MFAFSRSILEPSGEYRVETYLLSVHEFEEEIRIDLKRVYINKVFHF